MRREALLADTDGLEKSAQSMDGIDRRMDGMESRLNTIDTRLNGIDGKIDMLIQLVTKGSLPSSDA